MQSIDAPAMRRLNKVSVLRCIRSHGPISRIEIAHRTGLNKATVSSLVDELMAEALVEEVGVGQSRGGRKPVLVAFRAAAGYGIGIDVQITHLTATLCDLAGHVVSERTHPLRGRPLDGPGLVDAISDAVSGMQAEAPPSPRGVLGVGVGLPGMVDVRSGWVYQLPNVPVRDWPLGPVLSSRIGLPVWVDNDANCGAGAEIRLRGQVRHLVYIHAGVGVGAGIVIDGALYRGRRGIAGEWGHVPIIERGVPCNCGGYGCWEQYASERALARYLAESGAMEEVPVEWEQMQDFVTDVVRRAEAGAPAERRALTLLGHYLGLGLAGIVNALDPDVILLGGRLRLAYRHLLPEIRAVMRHRVMGPDKLVPIELGHELAVAIGAAALATQEDVLLSGSAEAEQVPRSTEEDEDKDGGTRDATP
ncbi:MAG: ROK family protein [Thermoflavifilum sp.]|nr:ROK family protein [Thermoflavifilum sp.]MCL6515056.1 ROK family protein [Alicyclobacillus sp.]